MQPDKQRIFVIALVVLAAVLVLWRVFAGVQAKKAQQGELKGTTEVAPTVAPEFDRIKQRMEEEK